METCTHFHDIIFLLEGMVSHHKNCTGWTSNSDFISCTHCGARFKQFRSIQTHTEKCHSNLIVRSTSHSQTSSEARSWCSPPRMAHTPDIVPRSSAGESSLNHSNPVAAHSSSGCEAEESEISLDVSQRRSPSIAQSQESCYSSREEFLAEKEVQLSELENLVRQTELKAEQIQKEKELSDWETNLRQRELECRRRLEEATRQLQVSDGESDSNNVLVPSVSSMFPGQLLGQTRAPIVIPSTAKLPPSAIKIPTSAPLASSTPTLVSFPPVSDDAPINLTKPKTTDDNFLSNSSISSSISKTNDVAHQESNNSLTTSLLLAADCQQVLPNHEDSSSQASTSNTIDLPCINIQNDQVFELAVKVVEDGSGNIEEGDNVQISYAVGQNSTEYILEDNDALETIFKNSGFGEVTFVAESGPEGQINLVPQNKPMENTDTVSEEEIVEQEEEVEQPVNIDSCNTDDDHPLCEGEKESTDIIEETGTSDVASENSPIEEDIEPTVNTNNELNERDDSETAVPPPMYATRKKRKLTISESENEVRNLRSKRNDKNEPEGFHCGRCKSVVQSERSWRRHKDVVHGGTARLKGHPRGQVFSSHEENIAWREAIKQHKKISCPRCNLKTFTKSVDVEEHLKVCNRGRIDQHFPPLASKIVEKEVENIIKPKPVIKENNNVTNIIVKEDEVGEKKSRRKAATKARSNVAAYVKAMKSVNKDGSESDADVGDLTDDSDDNFKVENEVNLTEFYEQKKIGKR